MDRYTSLQGNAVLMCTAYIIVVIYLIPDILHETNSFSKFIKLISDLITLDFKACPHN